MVSSFHPRKLAAWQVLTGLLVLRLLYLPCFGAFHDLAGDESYYWEWGRRLDWGYYSKPPMIGWLMGGVGFLTGNSEWGIRLAALGLGTLSLGMLAVLAKRLFGPPTALLTLWLAALTPANVALNLFFTIDAPLVFFWVTALFLFWRAAEEPARLWGWVWLALALGLGNLDKQMMLVFPALMILFASLTPARRTLLRCAGFWLSIVASLLFIAPVLWWNHQHQWITLEHTGHHFDTGHGGGVGKHLGTFFAFPASQAALFTPLTWAGITLTGFFSLWRWRTLGTSQRFLVLFSAPALIVFHLLAFRQNVNPNWAAVYYLSGIVLLAATWREAVPGVVPWQSFSRWEKPALIVAAAMTLGAYLLPLAIPAAGLAGHARWDPLARLRGWQEAGQEAGIRLAQAPRPAETFLVALGHRDHASQFAFYTPQHPRVYRWQPDGKKASQYELWPGPEEGLGRDAIILQPTDKPLPRSLVQSFSSMERLADIVAPLGQRQSRRWQVFLGRNLQSWPAPRSDR